MVIAAEIHASRYYDERGISHILSIPIDRIREECNRDRLKSVKRSGRRFAKGQWIIDWIEGGQPTDE